MTDRTDAEIFADDSLEDDHCFECGTSVVDGERGPDGRCWHCRIVDARVDAPTCSECGRLLVEDRDRFQLSCGPCRDRFALDDYPEQALERDDMNFADGQYYDHDPGLYDGPADY